MDRLQKLGRDLGYEGKDLQDFVAQENKRERDERAAEREIEKAKLAQQREIELAKVAAEEAKLAQQREIELANVKAEEAKIAQQREIELAKVETEKAKVVAEEAKLAQQREIELANVKAEEAKKKARIAQQREIELAKVEAAKIVKENEFELSTRLMAEEGNKLRDIELAKLAAEEARVLRDNDIELAKLTQQEELARLKSEHEKDKEIELARLHFEHEKVKMEQEIEHEKLKMEQEVELTQIDSQERQAKLDSDVKFAGQLELGKLGVEKAAHARNPKLPYFEETKDKMDSYLSRFEKYAVANKWNRSIWAAYLSALLKGRALEVYDRLSVADANDYEKLKDALLKNFDMTERRFRKKFRNDRPERSETFIQFGSRLRSYLDKWINMAKIENTFEAMCDFMARDQFLESCSRELYVHLKPKTFKNLDEMAKEADLFAEARGGVHTCTNKGQHDNRGAAQNHSKPDVNKGGGKQEIKCGICGKGHLTIKCYKNPNRMQANSAEVGNEAKGGDSDAKNEMQGAQARSDSFKNKGRGNSFGRSRNFPRGRGRGGNPPRGGGHQVNFCKTQIEERSENGIENINQSKGDNSINSVTKDKEGVCYFLKSRLPTARGTVNGKGVIAMRDTGCTGCVIRSNLVSEDQLLGKASDVTLINETTRYPLALIDIDCPFFSGQTEALCMDNTLYDVVIGNIDGSKLPDMSHFCAAVETRSQAKQCEKKYRKLKVPDQIINEDKEALKKAQAIDGNLANIRSRVKSGKVTVSRGLNRGQTKFVERKDLLYREFTKGNKVTLQLVVPEGFREKVMRLAHETLMSGHLGTKKTLDRVVAEFFWPGICGDVARFCKSCDICQRTT